MLRRVVQFCGLSLFLVIGSCLLSCTSEKVSERPRSTADSPKTSLKPSVAPVTEIPVDVGTQSNDEARSPSIEVTEPSPAEAPPAPQAAVTSLARDESEPQLTDQDGTWLPQTEQKPSHDSSWFKMNAARLFSAIVHDDAEQAQSFFFPKRAYAQVKAISDPDLDYETRLLKAFKADIHKYHRALGAHRDQVSFVELRVDERGAKWVKPAQEGNRLGYFRVLRSVIIYRDEKERTRELALHTMISWRGEWYIVHLGAFK